MSTATAIAPQVTEALRCIQDSKPEAYSHFLIEMFASLYTQGTESKGQQQRENEAFMFISLYELLDAMHKH